METHPNWKVLFTKLKFTIKNWFTLGWFNIIDARGSFGELLNRLNKSKAAGLDKISARLIRECADLICIPIRDIFNQSISQGIFPDDWKCAKVTPLFKQGDRDDLNNYRPISVISVMAKVFERIVYDQLYAYLEEHNIICKYQSGFRAIHSTVTALLEATDTWAYNIDRGKINVVVFLRSQKGFRHI